MTVELILGDCLEVLPMFADRCFDAVITDIPYGTTACAWDTIIPFEPMWGQLERLSKGAIVLFGSQPFTSALIMSAPHLFRCEWIWQKNRGSNFTMTRYYPMKEHEHVIVFGASRMTYNPIRQKRRGLVSREGHKYKASNTGKRAALGGLLGVDGDVLDDFRVPSSVQYFNTEAGLHPTQKPVALMEYLVRTYTNEGDTVLDFTVGSGSTGVACVRAGRSFVGIENNSDYFAIAKKRIEQAQLQERMPI